MAERETRKAKQGPRIMRDTHVPRITADAFYVYPLTDAVDVTLLISSADYTDQSFVESADGRLSAEKIDPRPTLFEVGRLRMDIDGIHNLLGTLIGVSIGAGLIEADAVTSMVDEARAIKDSLAKRE